ncbi:prolyl 4-hydroxylase subunit alpha-2 [Drosophila eugracilis]|uniref:prolyl 4-hydroxylase subunit alpha-2 n=1 Tax=Drosophila eugracilis TaxID=29029 RepID=UPI0007E8395B|nr:prolyl 4-hydroxylase subunit alpha-2 [Drosophila eugracilis]
MKHYLSLLAIQFLCGQRFFGRAEDKLNNESNVKYSSSNVGLLRLMEVEEEFTDCLINYIGQLEEETHFLQKYLSSVYTVESQKERVEYISNPLNAFSLLRRTHEDLPKWHAYFRKSIKNGNLSILDDIVKKVPHRVDLISAMRGIHRIERIYDLKIDDLAQGILQGQQHNIQLTYRDLIAMGHFMFEQRDYQAAAKWYRIACKHEQKYSDKLLNEVLGNPSEYLHRQFIKALFIYGTSTSDPATSSDEASIAAESSFAEASKEELDDIMSNLNDPANDVEVEKELYLTNWSPTNFEIGCQGLYRRKTNLVCRYKFDTTPFLRLAPLKFEEINLDPYIAMYHEVLYDSEIEGLKSQSVNMINAYATEKNGTEIRESVGQFAFWHDKSLMRERINQRIIDMTGFNFSKTDEIQVVNYGVGTYFNPHFDFTSDDYEAPDVIELGDRLSTVLFYASNVQQGGATVFPKINITVFPRKGSSLYWFNLLDDGRPDQRSQHSVCPVINGDRWTLTKWVHFFPQMFIMPCKSYSKTKSEV